MVEAFLLVLALAALVAALLVAALVRHGWRAVARRPRRLPRGLFPAALCAAASGLPILAPAPAAATGGAARRSGRSSPTAEAPTPGRAGPGRGR